MVLRFSSALSRAAARMQASRFAKPLSRAGLGAAGLTLLAVIGHVAAGSVDGAIAAAGAHRALSDPGPPTSAPLSIERPPAAPSASGPASVDSPGTCGSTAFERAPGAPASGGRSVATSEDPVMLNSAGVDDLRRLPGIGEKRAVAIVALRDRLGRFRAVEDLMKVRGIGRATLRRLRPLIRIDAPRAADAGVDSTSPPH
jgi:competence protein ComEA